MENSIKIVKYDGTIVTVIFDVDEFIWQNY